MCAVLLTSINSYKKDAIIIGIDMRKENSAASSFLTPERSRVEIVVPLREIPGTVAINWVKPTIADEVKPTSRVEDLMKDVEKRIIAVNRKAKGSIL